MVGWFGALGWGYKAAILGGISVVLVVVFLKWRSDLIEKGKLQGRSLMIDELAERYGEEWELALDEISTEREALEIDKGKVEEDKREVEGLRRRISQDLSRGLDTIRTTLTQRTENLSTLSDSDIPDAIRAVLAELRASDGFGTTGDSEPADRIGGDEAEGGSPGVVH